MCIRDRFEAGGDEEHSSIHVKRIIGLPGDTVQIRDGEIYVNEELYETELDLGTIENPEDIFAAEVMLAGLGAIMDVAVTISAALSELLEKKPDLTFRSLFRSGREIGYDIMGTMISVLLFTFGSSLIPSFLIRMNNEVSFLTIVRLHIPLEIVEFLIESIGIVAAIPISILISSCLLRRRGRRSETI